MATEREEALKKAEKLLRQGKLDLAIAEYARVVEEQPRDWNTRLLRAFVAWLHEQGYAKTTIARRLAAVGVLLITY